MSNGDLTLYHYTSAAGLIGILEDGGLHATDCRFVNDAREIDYAIREVALPLFDRARSNAPETAQPDGLRSSILAYASTLRLNEDRARLMQYVPGTVYISCLSEKEDQLSQWRGYSQGQTGIALGFSADGLGAMTTTEGTSVSLLKVKYEVANQEPIFLSIFENWRWNPPPTPGASSGLHSQVFEAAIQCKHHGFSEEAEWRLAVVSTWGPGYRGPALRFRDGGRYVVPFVGLQVADADGKLPLKVVRCGPCDDPDLMRTGIRELLNSYGYKTVPIEVSTIPFRAYALPSVCVDDRPTAAPPPSSSPLVARIPLLP